MDTFPDRKPIYDCARCHRRLGHRSPSHQQPIGQPERQAVFANPRRRRCQQGVARDPGQDAQVEPDIWKIEGIDSSETCAEIAALVKRDGRDSVGCVVLGRGADDAAVEAWLRAGAKVPGYLGFAIGRSIFNDAVKGVASGTMERDEATAIISRKYRHFIDVYEGRE